MIWTSVSPSPPIKFSKAEDIPVDILSKIFVFALLVASAKAWKGIIEKIKMIKNLIINVFL